MPRKKSSNKASYAPRSIEEADERLAMSLSQPAQRMTRSQIAEQKKLDQKAKEQHDKALAKERASHAPPPKQNRPPKKRSIPIKKRDPSKKQLQQEQKRQREQERKEKKKQREREKEERKRKREQEWKAKEELRKKAALQHKQERELKLKQEKQKKEKQLGMPSTAGLKMEIDAEGLLNVQRPEGWIGAYSPESRKVRIKRFVDKRNKRVWKRKIRYNVRKNLADRRLRVKGQFVKKEDELFMRDLMSLT